MARRDNAVLVDAVANAASPFAGAMEDFDPLTGLIGDARVVCIREATHGTHELYRQWAQLTKRLIVEKGFSAVAAEADWPDAYRVNRYVRDIGTDAEAEEALSNFKRFPAWGSYESTCQTRALEPLERSAEWERGEMPETFPTGM